MINRILAITLFLAVLTSGCATVNYKPTSNATSESPIHHELLQSAARSACDEFVRRLGEGALISSKVSERIASLRRKKKDLEDRINANPGYLSPLTDELKTLDKEITTAQSQPPNYKYEKAIKILSKSPIFLEIIYVPDASSARITFYRLLFEERLGQLGVSCVSSLKDAAYRLRVIVNYDGIDSRSEKVLYIYFVDEHVAVSNLTIQIIDTKTGEYILSDNIVGRSYYATREIFGTTTNPSTSMSLYE